ncbi:ferredoxin--NADP reductase [Paraherbaspirillum soli]|uniref:ferredoxin--NADP(+) reductase n=1 Tax=Paraherbaspirillum soli TaxID=631222 RepID=A0ABW0M388_9BURK
MKPNIYNVETVTRVHHWTDRLFTFATTRSPTLRFENGQFTMIGLPEASGNPILRAYSFASANHEEELEFFSIKVPDGPLTSRLQKIRKGDKVLVGRKPTGTLLTNFLLPGKRLYLFGTGTGLAPFLSIIKDPETYEKFDTVILVHGTRMTADLAYANFLTEDLPQHEYLGEVVRRKLLYYPTVTREHFSNRGRITALVESGQIFKDLGLPKMDVATDRAMICGSMAMLKDLRTMLVGFGFQEGTTRDAGHFVVERAFAD